MDNDVQHDQRQAPGPVASPGVNFNRIHMRPSRSVFGSSVPAIRSSVRYGIVRRRKRLTQTISSRTFMAATFSAAPTHPGSPRRRAAPLRSAQFVLP